MRDTRSFGRRNNRAGGWWERLSVAVSVLVALWLSASPASAADLHDPFVVIPGTELNTFYEGDPADYPEASIDLPTGCEAEGGELLVGERFATMSAPDHWVEDLRRINFGGLEEVVVMEWDSVAVGCEGGHISLSLKNSHETTFDIDDDQYAIASVACNAPQTPRCEDIGNRLVLPASLHGVMPCFQVDAHLGRQLRIIGPDQGFYYSFLNRNHDVLIGAKNGGFPPCTLDNPLLDDYTTVAIVACDHNPVLPAAAKECRATAPPVTQPTTPPATTTSTTPPAPTTSTTPPPFLARAAPTTAPDLTTTEPPPVDNPPTTAAPSTTVPHTIAAPPLTLPRTGVSGGQRGLALGGWLLFVCGLGIAGLGRRLNTR